MIANKGCLNNYTISFAILGMSSKRICNGELKIDRKIATMLNSDSDQLPLERKVAT